MFEDLVLFLEALQPILNPALPSHELCVQILVDLIVKRKKLDKLASAALGVIKLLESKNPKTHDKGFRLGEECTSTLRQVDSMLMTMLLTVARC